MLTKNNSIENDCFWKLGNKYMRKKTRLKLKKLIILKNRTILGRHLENQEVKFLSD